VGRELKAADVVDVPSDLFVPRGVPAHIRPDNGPEFVAKTVQAWIGAVGARTACIAPGSPWENGCVESFNARLRDELLDGEIFCTLREAEVVIESWRRHHNGVRPHASLGFRPPAPEVVLPTFAAWPAALRRPASPTMQVVAPEADAELTFAADHPMGADHGPRLLVVVAHPHLHPRPGTLSRYGMSDEPTPAEPADRTRCAPPRPRRGQPRLGKIAGAGDGSGAARRTGAALGGSGARPAGKYPPAWPPRSRRSCRSGLVLQPGLGVMAGI
jgi:hypothetical protein